MCRFYLSLWDFNLNIHLALDLTSSWAGFLLITSDTLNYSLFVLTCVFQACIPALFLFSCCFFLIDWRHSSFHRVLFLAWPSSSCHPLRAFVNKLNLHFHRHRLQNYFPFDDKWHRLDSNAGCFCLIVQHASDLKDLRIYELKTGSIQFSPLQPHFVQSAA